MVEYKYKGSYIVSYIPLVVVMGLLITASFFLTGVVVILRIAAVLGIVIAFVGYYLSYRYTYLISADKIIMRTKGQDKTEFLFSKIRTVTFTKSSIELGIMKEDNIKTAYISKHLENYDGFKNELLKQLYKSPYVDDIIINE